MTSILKLKQQEIDKGEGNYELYNEYNTKSLMDSLYVKEDNIDNFKNYSEYKNNTRIVPTKQICHIENDYKCQNLLDDFKKLQNNNNNEITELSTKYNEKINNNYNENKKKYNDLIKNVKLLFLFNIFLCLLIFLIIIIILTI